MNAGRFAPLVLAGLFAVRIAACGGGGAGTGKGGAGGAAALSATCLNGNVSYDTGAGQLTTQLCPNHDCWIDAATGSGACMVPDAAGAAPFRTCRTAADCAGATYCGTWGASSQIVLGSPTCADGVCDWATQAPQACAGGQLCYPFTCAMFQSTTSGGFPWNPAGPCGGGAPQPGCLGGGGAGGAGGAGGGAGGSTGSADPAATCVNGDISYVDNGGQAQTHACPSHDCWIDAATGSAACMQPSAAGVKPFRTCRAAADCSGATYCATWGDSFTMLLGSATCADNVCDWATQAQQSCSGGQLCWPAACATVWSGTTSGGFPWEACPAGGAGACGTTTPGRGGTGGAASGGAGGASAN